jgi:hypothetical protein
MKELSGQTGEGRWQRWIIVAACCLSPWAALANPVMLDPGSLLAFAIVAFWAFVVEAGIVALILTFCGLQPLRIFMIYFVIKAVVFLFLFQPLLERDWSIPFLEFLVVGINALAIKILTGLETFQSNNYRGLSWVAASAISLCGNAASFFVGLIAGHKPWEGG